jgi:GNAT superfamily N-acetyltransferase
MFIMNSHELTPDNLGGLIARVRSNSKRFVTNFFTPATQWPVWIRNGLRVIAISDRFILLARPEKGCVRLFFAGDRAEMTSRLPSATNAGSPARAVDLIGQPAQIHDLAEEFLAAGFRSHLRIFRLARAGAFEIASRASGLPPCVSAVREDIPAILELLYENFDIYADQLPGADEVRDAIEVGGIRVARGAAHLAGFLWYEKIGVTAHIRYWCVNPGARGCGVGGMLMRDYFNSTRGCARHLLWVRDNNAQAAACYRHYGYTPDGLQDQVMIFEK